MRTSTLNTYGHVFDELEGAETASAEDLIREGRWPRTFFSVIVTRRLLLPPSLRDWLPADHLAWFVLDAVEEMDLSAFYGAYREDGWGRAAFEPQMMVALLLYSYAVGERSSRGIERRCREDVAFRSHPQPAQTLARRPRSSSKSDSGTPWPADEADADRATPSETADRTHFRAKPIRKRPLRGFVPTAS